MNTEITDALVDSLAEARFVKLCGSDVCSGARLRDVIHSNSRSRSSLRARQSGMSRVSSSSQSGLW